MPFWNIKCTGIEEFASVVHIKCETHGKTGVLKGKCMMHCKVSSQIFFAIDIYMINLPGMYLPIWSNNTIKIDKLGYKDLLKPAMASNSVYWQLEYFSQLHTYFVRIGQNKDLAHYKIRNKNWLYNCTNSCMWPR